jgi:rhodanese-related sulfurtransferase
MAHFPEGRTTVTDPSEPKPPSTPDDIVARATERRTLMGLPYAGAVTPKEAWDLQNAGAAKIVDVRTLPEWQFVGHVPDAPLIEWPRNGTEEQLHQFLGKLQESFEPGERLLFLCRSGVRSHSAAELAAHAGFTRAYNILEGFEGGEPDKGWRAAGLPWKKG